MGLTDDQLLDFDASRYAAYDEGKARELLAGENGDAYRSQLVVARWIDGWRRRTLAQDPDDHSEAWMRGWDEPR